MQQYDYTKPPTITQMLATLNSGSEDDITYIIAATYNLYAEANRRLRGRVLFGPNDIKALHSIIDTLLTERENDPIPAKGRPFKLSDKESDSLLTALEEKIRERKEPEPAGANP